MTTIVWESKDGPKRLDITPYHEGMRGEAGPKKKETSQYDSKTSLSTTPSLDTLPVMLPTSTTIVSPVSPFSTSSSTSTFAGTTDTFTLPKTTTPSSTTITLKPSLDTTSPSLQSTPYTHTEVKLTINFVLSGSSDTGTTSTSGRVEFSDSGISGTTTSQNLTLSVEIPPIVKLHLAIFSNDTGAIGKILQASSNLAGLPDSSGRTPLHLAVDIGNKDIVTAILKNMNPKDIIKQDSQGYTPLHLAAGKGNSKISELLVNSMTADDIASIETKEWKYTPLHMVLRSNADPKDIAKIALHILDKAPKIASATDKANQTALHLAAYKGNEAVVRKLLEVMKEKDIEKTDEGWQGYTALHLAVQGGYYNIVDRILKRDPKLASIPDKYGQTALHLAAYKGNEDVVTKLLEVMKEKDIEKTDEEWQGYTALHLAVQGGYYNIVDRILKRDSKLASIPDKYGQTPLHWAVTKGNKPIIEALVKAMSEIDLFQKSEAGYIALNFAKDQELQKWIIDIIKKKEVDIHTEESEKVTDFTASFGSLLDTSISIENSALEKIAEAIDTGNTELVTKEIEALGIKLSFTDKIFGKTLLHMAIECGNKSIIEQLFKALEESSLPLAKIVDNSGDTLLHTALICRQNDLAKSIIDKIKGDKDFINLTNNEGKTALNFTNNLDMVKYLLKEGAKIESSAGGGKALLNSAAASGDIEMLKLFLDHVTIDETTIRSAVQGLVHEQENIQGSTKVLRELRDKLKSTVQGQDKLGSFISTMKKEFAGEEDFSLASNILEDTGINILGRIAEE